jgi:hypothetical protein
MLLWARALNALGTSRITKYRSYPLHLGVARGETSKRPDRAPPVYPDRTTPIISSVLWARPYHVVCAGALPRACSSVTGCQDHGPNLQGSRNSQSRELEGRAFVLPFHEVPRHEGGNKYSLLYCQHPLHVTAD